MFGVTAGAKVVFNVLAGICGENDVRGLFAMDEARKMLPAAEMETELRLLDGSSSRLSARRAGDAMGVPERRFGVDVKS